MTQPSCFACGTQEAPVLCENCERVSYCSDKCKKWHLHDHEQLCAAYQNQTPRPSLDHYNAIFFAPDSTKPKLVWITHEHEIPTIHGVSPGVWVDPGKESAKMRTTCYVDHYSSLKPIRICYYSDQQHTQMPNNKSLLCTLARHMEHPGLLFKGPVLVYAQDQSDSSTHCFYNIVHNHLRYFIHCCENPPVEKEGQPFNDSFPRDMRCTARFRKLISNEHTKAKDILRRLFGQEI